MGNTHGLYNYIIFLFSFDKLYLDLMFFSKKSLIFTICTFKLSLYSFLSSELDVHYVHIIDICLVVTALLLEMLT